LISGKGDTPTAKGGGFLSQDELAASVKRKYRGPQSKREKGLEGFPGENSVILRRLGKRAPKKENRIKNQKKKRRRESWSTFFGDPGHYNHNFSKGLTESVKRNEESPEESSRYRKIQGKKGGARKK